MGRVAFWTDDESAKVNVNTASEGTYWDTPVCNSGTTTDTFTYPQTAPLGDVVLANYQGAQHEYQRYPGHPATTCLSSVFGAAVAGIGSRAAIVKALTDAVPRITDVPAANAASGSSSMGGTQAPAATPAPLATDLDRLYASLDEFQFTPTRVAPNLKTGATQGTQDNLVDACRFFLTAHSKAPELNLFGLPRVAIWPVWSTAGNRTPFDAEIMRCATLDAGGDPHQMAFQRYDSTSPTNDWLNIARNQQVYGYLQQLTSRPIPGFGGSFLSQYGPANRDQILTEIFDYIRSTNLADNSVSASGVAATPYTGVLGTGTQGNVTVSPPNAALGQVVPIQVSAASGNTTHGLGRIATIAELGLVLVKVDDRISKAYAENAPLPATGQYPDKTPNVAQSITVSGAPGITTVAPATQTLVEWALVPKLCSPMAGYVALANNIRLKFTKINLVIGGASTTGPYTDMYDVGRISCEQRDSVMGGLIGCETLVENAYQNRTGSPASSMYPTGLCVLPGKSGSPMTISGSVEVQLLAPNTATAPLQTFEFTFPAAGVSAPIPQLYYADSPPTPPSTTPPSYAWYGTFRAPESAYSASLKAGFAYPANTNKNPARFGPSYTTFIGGNDSKGIGTDTVRSLVPTGALNNVNAAGDLRLISLTQSPQTFPTTTFALTLNSNGVTPPANWYAADCMRCGRLISITGSSQGALTSLIPAGSYFGNTPEVPRQPSGTSSVPFPGDWDNGPGLMIDGPWANKPDEGMTAKGTELPYIGFYETTVESGAQRSTLFSPNRQISSPVMFGSLPSNWLPGGVSPVQPWRTLLFRPATLLSATAHPGGANATIRDHLLLDMFWMPVVEPYGISEPLATSGKINLNTQIEPFTYITRQTGMNAVLKSVMITALNPSARAYNGNGFARWYKDAYLSVGNPTTTRYPIDAIQTINQLNPSTPDQGAFPEFSRPTHTAAAPNFFVSASQICDVPLIPVDVSHGHCCLQPASFWTTNSLTGDNSLERPYSMIYPRVTTKSNIFTVHVLAQSLKQTPDRCATEYLGREQGPGTQ